MIGFVVTGLITVIGFSFLIPVLSYESSENRSDYDLIDISESARFSEKEVVNISDDCSFDNSYVEIETSYSLLNCITLLP